MSAWSRARPRNRSSASTPAPGLRETHRPRSPGRPAYRRPGSDRRGSLPAVYRGGVASGPASGVVAPEGVAEGEPEPEVEGEGVGAAGELPPVVLVPPDASVLVLAGVGVGVVGAVVL